MPSPGVRLSHGTEQDLMMPEQKQPVSSQTCGLHRPTSRCRHEQLVTLLRHLNRPRPQIFHMRPMFLPQPFPGCRGRQALGSKDMRPAVLESTTNKYHGQHIHTSEEVVDPRQLRLTRMLRTHTPCSHLQYQERGPVSALCGRHVLPTMI